jgi:hypothetical protein
MNEPKRKRKYHQGRFIPINPSKYRGDSTAIFYRSGWELKLFKYLDNHPNIIEWSSEEIIIPYISPLDGHMHRYFPDVWVKIKLRDGKTKQAIYEIKPYVETQEPVKKKRITQRFVTEVATYAVNKAKWEACSEYCADKGWEFRHITEAELGIKS